MIKMNMLGINLDCISYEDMYPIFDKWLDDKSSRSHRLAVINVHICVTSLFNKKLRDLYNSADLIGIDSMPFVKWARIFYNKKSDHLNAPDIMLQVSSKVKEKGYTYFLYGGFPGAPEKIEEFLKSRYEGIQVIGKYSPPFRPMTEEEDNNLCKMINELKPDFIWVGLGSPKQDVWISDHVEKIQGSIFVPSGATFDFYSGRIKQAPTWLRNLGFEWFFRLTQDFRRLWVRYTVFNFVFIFFFFLNQIRIISFDPQGYFCFLGKRTNFGNS